MKTLTQKRQTSGSSGLKQSTSTFPLRNFLKHLETGGERLVKAKMENHTIQCLSPHCHHTTGAFGEQVNKGLIISCPFGKNGGISLGHQHVSVRLDCALLFKHLSDQSDQKGTQQQTSRQICGPWQCRKGQIPSQIRTSC